MISRPIVFESFAGRTEEFAHLVERRRAAGNGRGGLVLVGGHAGIGKTRLIAEFVAPMMRGTTRVARAQCREFAQNPFEPIDEALRSLEAQPTPRRIASADGRFKDTLAAIEATAAKRTTLIVIEDLHWGAPELFELLSHAGVRGGHQRLLIVASYRDDEIVVGHRNFAGLGALLREPTTTLVSLEALPSESMEKLLTNASRSAASTRAALPSFAVAEIAARSEGNPFFGEELLRSQVDRAPGTPDGWALPVTIQAVIQERIARCDAAEHESLVLAAICGRRFDRTLLADLLAIDDGRLGERLENLVALQLIVAVPNSNAYEFRHALTREFLATSMTRNERAPLHQRVAEHLAKTFGNGSRIVEIAHHRWESGARAEEARTYEAAAAAARAELAFSESIRWYERTVAALQDDLDERTRVELALGTTLVAALEPQRGLVLYERVIRAARDSGNWALLVRARKLVAGLLSNDQRIERAIDLLEETLAEVPIDTDPAVRIGLALRIVSYRETEDDKAAAKRVFSQIDRAAIEPRSSNLAEYYGMRSTLAAAEFDEIRWLEDAAAAADIYRLREAPMFVRYVHVNVAWQALGMGRLAIARTHLRLAIAASAESAATLNDAPLTAALVELAAGDLDAAEAWLAKVGTCADLMSRKLRAIVSVEVAAARGDSTRVRALLDLRLLDEATGVGDTYGEVHLACAFAAGYAALERFDEADRLYDRAAEKIASIYRMIPAIVTISRYRPAHAQRLRDLIVAEPARSSSEFVRAGLSLVEAEIAASKGDEASASIHATSARAGFRAAGWASLAARATELSGNGREAMREYRECGLVLENRRLERSGKKWGEVTADSLLTPREREVAHLVAEGSSNRDVAAALGLSEKTIEKHLGSVFSKLNIDSRTMLRALVGGHP